MMQRHGKVLGVSRLVLLSERVMERGREGTGPVLALWLSRWLSTRSWGSKRLDVWRDKQRIKTDWST